VTLAPRPQSVDVPETEPVPLEPDGGGSDGGSSDGGSSDGG